ncbi:MAG: response regulator [Bacteroidota bacterium]
MEEKIKILIIEDNPGDVRLINAYLKGYSGDSYTFSIADQLWKGLELLSDEIFDIIILDLSLPDSSGLDTFKRTYEHSPQIPIIVLTGLDSEIIGMNAMKLGAQDFLVKGSIKGKELTRSINYSIERFKLLKAFSENTKKLEEKTLDLLIEQQKLKNAQKIARIGSWDWDIVKNTVAFSDELYRIYGLKCGEFIADFNSFINMIHPEDREYVQKTIEDATYKLQPLNFKHRIVRPNNRVRILHTISQVISDKDGKPIRMQGTEQDVTEQFHKEELEKLVLAATQSYNSVVIADSKGKIEWVNQGFTKLTGYDLDEILTINDGFLKDVYNTEVFDQNDFYKLIITEKKPITYESKNVSKNGEEYWVITTLTPVLGKRGDVEKIIAIDSDITLRKKIEEELFRSNKIAEESMKVKEQFMTNMSHEIRTPMNAIVGFTDLLLQTELNIEQKQFIDAIQISGKNLLVIINDILTFSKIKSGKLIFEQINFRLSQVFSSITALLLPNANEKNIHLSSTIDSNIPDHLIGDPLRLNQIILNLVGNAIKFTKQGEVKIKVELVSEIEDILELSFSVSDSGIGISKEKLSEIFEEFSQASSQTTRKYGGTGLGLAIAKQLIEQQGGSISVESEIDKGSKFTFNLKFKKNFNPEFETVKDVSCSVENLEGLKGLKILLVEDNLLNQILAKKILSNWKCRTTVAENGLIAIEKLEKDDFDLIIMDIQMPEMDGNEATKYIRTKFPSPKCNTPILAMTAHALAGEEEKCIRAGMNDYISKPFDTNVVYSKIMSMLKKNNSI